MRNIKFAKPPKNCCCKRYGMQNRGPFTNYERIILAGLKNDLNYKLLKFDDCPVEIVTDLGCRVTGKIHEIGIDFVDVLTGDGLVLTFSKDKIDQIHWSLEDFEPHHNYNKNHNKERVVIVE